MAVSTTGVVSLDCTDPHRLGEFWAAMLDGEVAYASDVTVLVRTGWVWLAMIRIPDHVPPTWPDPGVPKQIHLDLAVDDLPAAVGEALALGAVEAGFQPAPDLRRILLDPAGHPFCLTTQMPPVVRGG